MSDITILRVDASMNRVDSTSRMLAGALVERLARGRDAEVIVRDLADGVSFVDERWIEANFTDPSLRSPAQQAVLAESDAMVRELKAADVLVMGVPIYNLGPPAAFKAWIDLIARARETFRYTSAGPRGLLGIRKAYLIVSSGGTPVGGDTDFVTSYTKIIFNFLGVADIEVISCDGLMTEGEEVVEHALSQISIVGDCR